jgi:hypothetical protein
MKLQRTTTLRNFIPFCNVPVLANAAKFLACNNESFKCASTFTPIGLAEKHAAFDVMMNTRTRMTEAFQHQNTLHFNTPRPLQMLFIVEASESGAITRLGRQPRCHTWAAQTAYTHSRSRYRLRRFCNSSLGFPAANTSYHKTLRGSAKDVIACLVGACQRTRFRTRAR